MIVKKVVLAGAAVVAVAVLAWVVSAAGGDYVAKRSAAKAWPATLGSLTAVPKRFPVQEQNAAATKLVQIAAGAGVNVAPLEPGKKRRNLHRDATDRLLTEIGLYVTAQLERPGDAIEAPPEDVARFLETSDAQLTAVRHHLIHGGELQWASDVSRGASAPVPNLLGHMNLQRLLMARALDRARSGNLAAWDELHASWELSRGLWGRPELISNIIALASARMTNAAARKMPTAEPPAWFMATRTFDPLKPIIAAHQVEAWQMHEAKPYDGGLAVEVQRALVWPMDRFEVAEAIDQTRQYVEAVERSGACDARNVPAKLSADQPNIASVYQRALRLRVEMEATDRVLALRRGETPSTQSRCTDGSWVVTPTSVKFSSELKLQKPTLHVPLEYSR
jgi:hypothetical protein